MGESCSTRMIMRAFARCRHLYHPCESRAAIGRQAESLLRIEHSCLVTRVLVVLLSRVLVVPLSILFLSPPTLPGCFLASSGSGASGGIVDWLPGGRLRTCDW